MYCLRHTFATRCEEAGISVKQTAQWLGHSNIKTTLENYVTISNEFEKMNIELKNLKQIQTDTIFTQKQQQNLKNTN